MTHFPVLLSLSSLVFFFSPFDVRWGLGTHKKLRYEFNGVAHRILILSQSHAIDGLTRPARTDNGLRLTRQRATLEKVFFPFFQITQAAAIQRKKKKHAKRENL